MSKENHNICKVCLAFDQSIFGQLDRALYDEISKSFKCNTLQKNEVLFKNDQNPKGVFIVHQGKLKVCKSFENAKEQIIHISAEGELLGIRSIFGGQKYKVSAVALEECKIAFIETSTFQLLLADFPELRDCIIKSLSNELIDRASFIASLAQKSVKERIAQALIQLYCIYKTEPINLSREDMANFVGTATETIIRVLREMKNEKIIDIQGRKISIKDQAKLVLIAGA